MLMVVSGSRVQHILWAFSIVASKDISACWRVAFFNGVSPLFSFLPLPSHSLIFHRKHGVMDAWTTWCGVGAHGWVAEIASHGRGPPSTRRGGLVTVEAPRHPSPSPIFHSHIVPFYLLMLLPSFKRTPSAPLLLALSLPAKSTRLSLLTFSPTDYKWKRGDMLVNILEKSKQ